MPFSWKDVLLGGVLPAIVAAALILVQRRRLASGASRNLLATVPFLAGFLVGYWSLSLGKVVPRSHWEWLPWAMLLTLPSGLGWSAGRHRSWTRVIVTTCIAALSSWLLVPTWEHLEPSRLIYWILLTIGVLFVVTLLEPLESRFPAVGVLSLLAAVLTAAAIILALSGSLRFAQMAGCGVAALCGMVLAGIGGKQSSPVVGIALPWGLLISALMVIGQTNSFSDVPAASYLLLPVAPLTLWLSVNDSLSQATGYRRWLVLSIPLVVCAVAVGIAIDASGEMR